MSQTTSPHARPFGTWDGSPPPELPEHGLAWLSDRLGAVSLHPPKPPAEIQLLDGKLPDEARAALVGAVGAENVRSDRLARLRHSVGGSSFDDLIRQRAGTGLNPPDAVVAPGGEAQVLDVLRIATEHRLAIVAVGGGTSVVRGVEAVPGVGHSAVVALDLSLMRGLIEVDTINRTARFLPGTTGPEAEEKLAEFGLSLGHVPQSFERATLGGYAATRSAGQASAGFGRFDTMTVALRMATPRGVVAVGTGTPNAAGPDLRHLVLGSEGAFGIITEVTVRVRPKADCVRYEGWMFPDFTSGLDVLRSFVQDGPRTDTPPDICRLSDPDETELQLALRGHGVQAKALDAYLRLRHRRNGCIAIFGWEGAEKVVAARRSEATEVIKSAGGVPLGGAAGSAWHRHRFDAPKQRDTLLEQGVLVETLETATTWSNLLAVRTAAREALIGSLSTADTAPLVLCHVSHVYPAGASLYFTVMARMVGSGGRDWDAEPIRAQWHAAKTAVSDAIVGAGASITHHHAIGRDHAPWLRADIGDLGVDILRAVKADLDPAGIMNPGALLEQ